MAVDHLEHITQNAVNGTIKIKLIMKRVKNKHINISLFYEPRKAAVIEKESTTLDQLD